MNERLDLYRNVHKGIRVMLFDLVRKSGRTNFRDRDAVARLTADVRDIFELLESHAHTEDTFVMPLLRKHAPELATAFDAEHEDQEARLPGLLAALERIDSSAPAAERQGHLFCVQLSRIAGELLTHMADEELEINTALWRAMSDAELLEVEHRLVASIPPEKMGRYLTWMLPSMNHTERVKFLGVLPPPVFAFVRELAKQVLEPADEAMLPAA
jgi:Hemerythrin HHE cation binding domain